jgi:hypothetical protein
MEHPKYEKDNKSKRYKLEMEELASIVDAHVDEAIKLIESELLSYVHKHILLRNISISDTRVQLEDFRTLLPK